MKHMLFLGANALALFVAAPSAAQDDVAADPDQQVAEEDTEAAAGLFENIFGKAEPLSIEQEARLPMAEAVVMKIFPEGTYAKMMNDTMKPMMDGMMGSFMDVPMNEIAKLSGLFVSDMPELGEGSIKEVMEILDPAFEERSKLIADLTIQLVTDTMTQVEPAYRDGLARAYAVRFDDAELADLNAYFSTSTGAKYAAESMLIYTDPQVMSAMNDLMPAMMNMMPQMMEQIAEATDQFPAARTFSELSSEEQARLSELLGVTQDVLRENEPDEAALESY